MPSDRPQLSVIARFGKELRRTATQNRLFDTTADRTESVHNRRRDFQTARSQLLTRINGRTQKAPK